MLTRNNKTIIAGLTVAIVFVLVGMFFLSYAWETLDAQAEELGAREQPIYDPPLPDYNIPGLDNQWTNGLLGVASTLLLFGVAFAVAKLLNKKKGGEP